MSYSQFYQPFTGVVRHLIILNALMFVGTFALLGAEAWSTANNAYTSLGRMQLAAFMPGSIHYQPYQIVTHMFMHADFGHLAFNMLALFFFGPQVERALGHKQFLFYYLFCGLGSFACHMGVQWWELADLGYDPRSYNGAMLGASGAIFGIFVAFAYLFPNQIVSLIIPPVNIKAKYFVLIMAAVELFYGVRGDSTPVAHFAHLGGALFGFGLMLYWNRFRYR